MKNNGLSCDVQNVSWSTHHEKEKSGRRDIVQVNHYFYRFASVLTQYCKIVQTDLESFRTFEFEYLVHIPRIWNLKHIETQETASRHFLICHFSQKNDLFKILLAFTCRKHPFQQCFPTKQQQQDI